MSVDEGRGFKGAAGPAHSKIVLLMSVDEGKGL